MEEEIRGEQARAREQSALLELSQIKVKFGHVTARMHPEKGEI